MFNTLIVIPLYNFLVFLFVIFRDMGVAIILLTVLVRLALLRFSVKAEKARLELQKLQPQLNKIKEKHKDDKDAQAREMMKLYQKEGVNPFASCLPTLLQLPFLFGIFYVFRDLSKGFPLYSFVKDFLGNLQIGTVSFGLLDLTKSPNTGWLIILPIIATGLQYIQSRMMMGKSGTTSGNPMNATMMIFPALTLWFTLSFASALCLYWISTTAFGIVQQIMIDKYEVKHHPELKEK